MEGRVVASHGNPIALGSAHVGQERSRPKSRLLSHKRTFPAKSVQHELPDFMAGYICISLQNLLGDWLWTTVSGEAQDSVNVTW